MQITQIYTNAFIAAQYIYHTSTPITPENN